ncbi:rwd domain-containing protein [Coemansia javaensis]|uniref:Rwd domain-containing protein n=1 Tax=Coemansia javaensis TaxID=2761396 RepID=A0A9W8LI50_9FUNG|nr:rwd domain-containing protein [Coemansia javaensis]
MADGRYAEEQASEIEILQSIYPDELELHGPGEFSIAIAVDEEDVRPCALSLRIKYTPEYPDQLPEFSVEVVDGADGAEPPLPPPGETDAVLDADDIAALCETVRGTGEESLGIAMVFSMAAALKEAAGQRLAAKTDALRKSREARLQREIAAEQAKFIGTMVTRDSFLAWKAKFEAEAEAAGAAADSPEARAARRAGPRPEDRPTGRQLFEQDRSLAKSDSRFLADGDTSVDASLFDRAAAAAADDDDDEEDKDDEASK